MTILPEDSFIDPHILGEHEATSTIGVCGSDAPVSGSELPKLDPHRDVVAFAKATHHRLLEEDEKTAQSMPEFFASQHNDTLKFLSIAYAFGFGLINAGEQELARVSKTLPGRRRAAHCGDEFVVAAMLCLKPDVNDRKQTGKCSQYATMLIYAAVQRVPLNQFIETMQNVSLKHCRECARFYRQSLPGAKVELKRRAPEYEQGSLMVAGTSLEVAISAKLLAELKAGQRKTFQVKLIARADSSSKDAITSVLQ